MLLLHSLSVSVKEVGFWKKTITHSPLHWKFVKLTFVNSCLILPISSYRIFIIFPDEICVLFCSLSRFFLPILCIVCLLFFHSGTFFFVFFSFVNKKRLLFLLPEPGYEILFWKPAHLKSPPYSDFRVWENAGKQVLSHTPPPLSRG